MIVACDKIVGDVDAKSQGGNRTRALGSLDIDAFEFDAVGGRCCSPSSDVATMVNWQGTKSRKHQWPSAAEKGRGPEFGAARNIPPSFFGGAGKNSGHRLSFRWRHLRPACHATPNEVARKPDQPRSKRPAR